MRLFRLRSRHSRSRCWLRPHGLTARATEIHRGGFGRYVLCALNLDCRNRLLYTMRHAELTMKMPTLSLLFFGAVAHLTLFAQATQLPPPSQMKTLGLIGGTSWYSTVD